MKLDIDFELLYDLELVGDHGLSRCTVPNGNIAGDSCQIWRCCAVFSHFVRDQLINGCPLIGIGDLPVCPKYSSYDIVEEYANDKDKWVHDFAIVFDKMLLNKVDLGRLVDLS